MQGTLWGSNLLHSWIILFSNWFIEWNTNSLYKALRLLIFFCFLILSSSMIVSPVITRVSIMVGNDWKLQVWIFIASKTLCYWCRMLVSSRKKTNKLKDRFPTDWTLTKPEFIFKHKVKKFSVLTTFMNGQPLELI